MSHYSGSVPDTARRPDWRDRASCAGADTNAWFTTDSRDIHTAKAICGGCPAQTECLGFALDEHIQYGIFGGLTVQERQQIRRARTRSRTRRVRRPGTLKELLARHSQPQPPGHRVWKGPKKIHWKGQEYTPIRLAYLADRGHAPNGSVYRMCQREGCVQPAHLADTQERHQRRREAARLEAAG